VGLFSLRSPALCFVPRFHYILYRIRLRLVKWAAGTVEHRWKYWHCSPFIRQTGTATRLASGRLEEVDTLRFEHVSKDYVTEGSSVAAVRDVSLDFRPGEFVALVGRSGCGKSTLLNLAGSMDFPTSGNVWLDGVSTSTLGDAALTRIRREKVGFVFQSFQLLPTLSVIENVELPLMLAGRKQSRAVATERLHWVEMDAYANRLPYQLSGGQMQRVAIARAVANTPSILLADEPTGNLDTTTSEVILALLRRIADELDAIVLMATHSVEAIGKADTIVRLQDGRVESVIPAESPCPR
jgi:ABC-type lipoprotein export system ATPase subunit